MSLAADGAPAPCTRRADIPRPVLWCVLALPVGVHAGFVRLALTFSATSHGMSIQDGGWILGAHLIAQWLKWLWAPAVDLFGTPRRWYLSSVGASAALLVGLACWPWSTGPWWLLLCLIGLGGVVNSIVLMAVEVMITRSRPQALLGTVSAWFQAGHLGGMALGGAAGLWLLGALPNPAWTGAALVLVMFACLPAVRGVPVQGAAPHRPDELPGPRQLGREVVQTFRTPAGRLTAGLCLMPIATGSAFGVLAQAQVAAHWGAGRAHVAITEGVFGGVMAVAGCFAGGALCRRWSPGGVYLAVGAIMAAVALVMAAAPAVVASYVIGVLAYAFVAGMTLSAFAALALAFAGPTGTATKYSLLASMANFPIWWSGLALAAVADRRGPEAMLFADAALGLAGIALISALAARQRRGP